MIQNRRQELLAQYESIAPSQALFVRSAFDRFDTRSVHQGITERLRTILNEAENRGPTVHHVFMHHTSPFLDSEWLNHRIHQNYSYNSCIERIQDCIAAYRSRLLGYQRDSQPIYIQSNYDSFSRDRSCSSLSVYGRETGFVSEKDLLQFLQFTSGLHSEDAFVIHGAYVGACIDHFALQIIALKLFQQYQIPSFADSVAHDVLSAEEESAMQNFENTMQLSKIAQVRYGTVFDVYNARGRSDLRQSVEYMMGSDTEIFPRYNRK